MSHSSLFAEIRAHKPAVTGAGHATTEEITEWYDAPEELKAKVKQLAELFKHAKHAVAYTGAGISTAAKIPDYRGPEGIWTLRDQGKKPSRSMRLDQAQPTLAHMSLCGLVQAGRLQHVVSTNIDGLHCRSGLGPEHLSELHGNAFKEVCQECGHVYHRGFDCTKQGCRTDHWTTRHCEQQACNGRLLDTIIHFGETLPQGEYRSALDASKPCDLALVLGTSMRVSPAAQLPEHSYKNGGSLVIVNLQKTPYDKYAAVRIFAKVDVVMSLLMRQLALDIPDTSPRGDVIDTTVDDQQWQQEHLAQRAAQQQLIEHRAANIVRSRENRGKPLDPEKAKNLVLSRSAEGRPRSRQKAEAEHEGPEEEEPEMSPQGMALQPYPLPQVATVALKTLLSKRSVRKEVSGLRGPEASLANQDLKPRNPLMIRDCHDCSLVVPHVTTKLCLEGCSNLELSVPLNVLTGVLELINCRNVSLSIMVPLPTITVDMSPACSIKFDNKLHLGRIIISLGCQGLVVQPGARARPTPISGIGDTNEPAELKAARATAKPRRKPLVRSLVTTTKPVPVPVSTTSPTTTTTTASSTSASSSSSSSSTSPTTVLSHDLKPIDPAEAAGAAGNPQADISNIVQTSQWITYIHPTSYKLVTEEAVREGGYLKTRSEHRANVVRDHRNERAMVQFLDSFVTQYISSNPQVAAAAGGPK